jgi:hypothetical protein
MGPTPRFLQLNKRGADIEADGAGCPNVCPQPDRLPHHKNNQRRGADPTQHRAVQFSPESHIATQPSGNRFDHQHAPSLKMNKFMAYAMVKHLLKFYAV